MLQKIYIDLVDAHDRTGNDDRLDRYPGVPTDIINCAFPIRSLLPFILTTSIVQYLF